MCQDQLSGGLAEDGVISLCGASLRAPSLVAPEFKEFFRLGRAMRVVLPTGDGGVVHLFVVYCYQGSEEDSEKTFAHRSAYVCCACCKEYISNYRKLATKTVYLQHEQQHER